MKIFSQLVAKSDDLTLRDACQAITRLVRDLKHDSSVWSLAELGADDDDLCWLIDWSSNLDADMVRRWQVSPPHRAAFGSLLLLFASEYTRRCLPRDGDWFVPASILFSPQTRSELFDGADPSAFHRQALIEAARKLRLRGVCAGNDLDLECLRKLVFAQIGFTGTDIKRQLACWMLAGEQPASINALLDSQTGSQSFLQFWESGRAYLSGSMSVEIFRQRLAETTWCLPQWIDPMVSALCAAQPPLPMAVPVNADALIQSSVTSQDIFAAIDLDESQAVLLATCNAVRALNARADARQIGRERWSLAELQPSDYDFIWLRVWLKRLDEAALKECATNDASFDTAAGKVKWDEAIGLLLLFWLSETARRKSVEGELWPCVAEGYFTEDTQTLLFTQGRPTQLLYEMLRAAAERFHLRHVLHEAGGMRWLNTVFLQFGLTWRGMRQRLPEWLIGQSPPLAVAALLDERGGSASFRQMWQALRARRLNQASDDHLRRELDGNPWLLPEWIDDVIRLASDAPIQNVTASPALDSFLSQPLLRWYDGGSPHFVCQLAAPSNLNLTDDCYDVRVGRRTVAQLLRQQDGSYQPTPSHVITLDFDQLSITANMVNPQGETVAGCDLSFWPPDDEVVIYRLPSGERLPDAFNATLSPNLSYALLTAADLTVEPEPQEWQLANSQCAKLYRLQAPWPAETKVRLEGELLWEPSLRLPSAPPNWTNQVDVFAAEERAVRWGEEFQIRIIHPPDVVVVRARCLGRALPLARQDETKTLAGPLVITPEFNTHRLNVRLCLQKDGRQCTVQRTLIPNVIGAKHLTDGKWERLNKHSVLTVSQAKSDWFELVPPVSWSGLPVNIKDLFLFEGDCSWRRLPQGLSSLGELQGWGAPLRVRPLFNFKPGMASLWLAKSVINHGELEEAICDALPNGAARLLRLRFRKRIEPGELHSVFWWDASGELIRLAPKYHDEAEGAWWWVCDLPEECSEMLAVAVAYAGERMGSWWPEERWLRLAPELIVQDAKRTAALLRWFHLPLLSHEAVEDLRPFIAEQPIAFLKAWLLNQGLPDELEFPPKKDEAWLGVVRTLFREWRPDAEVARQTLLSLADVDDDDLSEFLSDAAKHLLEVDPLLMARVLRAWQLPQQRSSIDELRLQLAECDSLINLNQFKTQLLKSICNLFPQSPDFDHFVQSGILNRAVQALNGARVENADENNLALAARFDDLRLLLALHLLERL